MKRLTLKRISSSPYVTQGVLIDTLSGLPLCVTLENPWKGNTPYISCIPTGIYKCKPYTSDKHRDVYEIEEVPARSVILFHIGNTEDDTQGCILPGMKYGFLSEKPAVLESKIAINLLKSVVGNNKFILEVCNG
jgi:hypothetical protein